MPQLQALSKSKHANYGWVPFTRYDFAAFDAFVVISASEFQKAATVAPVVFRQVGEGFQPVFLQGLQSGVNLFVSRRGQWLVDYVPAYYRSHPFCLAHDEGKQRVLCFHADSEFVIDDKLDSIEAKPFLVGEKLSEELSGVVQFLEAVDVDRQKTEQLMGEFLSLELFTPWCCNITLGEEKHSIDGFYRLDDNKLRSLSGDKLERLMKIDALGVAYSHLLSLNTVTRLERLFQARQGSAGEQDELPIEDKVATLLGDDRGINLDGLG